MIEISEKKQIEYLESKGIHLEEINININKKNIKILVAFNSQNELVVPIKISNLEYEYYQHINESFVEVFNSDIRLNIPYSC